LVTISNAAVQFVVADIGALPQHFRPRRSAEPDNLTVRLATLTKQTQPVKSTSLFPRPDGSPNAIYLHVLATLK
jgi:hypothetical protein